MRGIFTFTFLFVFSIVSNQAFSQCPVASPVPVATFDFNDGPEGFTSTGFNYSAGGFRATGGNNAQLSGTITTSNFVLPVSFNGTVAWSFTLASTGGNSNVTSYSVYARTSPNPATPFTLLCTAPLAASYNGARSGQVTSPLLANSTVFQLVFVFNYSVTGGNSIVFDNFGTNAGSTIQPLPVEFISLDATKEGNSVQLLWKVGSENNVKRYEVERSTNGSTYSTIGSVIATNSSEYRFTDVQPINGTVYYRVKNVDNDGKFKYSTVVTYANGRSTVQLKAFPTVTRGLVTVQHPAIRTNTSIIFSNSEGRTLRAVVPVRGTTTTPVDFTSYPAGSYVIRFQSEGGNLETFRIVKQ